MGRVAVINHGDAQITLSMVKWRARRFALYVGKKLGIINRFSIALFIPKYEIAVFDGNPKAVISQTSVIIFYYPSSSIAFEKWDELASLIERKGLYGISDFIRAGHPREQGLVSNLKLDASPKRTTA